MMKRAILTVTVKRHSFSWYTSYGESLAIWNTHTVLPSTQHKWTHWPVLNLPTLEGWKAELT